jgi:apolipoprotein N-acyltransferase
MAATVVTASVFVRGKPFRIAPVARLAYLSGPIVIGSSVALIAWFPGHWLWALLILPAAWARLRTRAQAFLLWSAYYLVGTRDLPVMAERFLGKVDGIATHAAVTIGIAAWITTSALLASPWAAFAPRGRSAPTNFLHAVLATLAVTLPPLGLIGWLSPLHVSGALFPGWGIAGLGLGLLVTGFAATISNPGCRLALGSLLVAGAIVNDGYTAPAMPAGWVALNTAFGAQDERSYASLFQRTVVVQKAAAAAFADGAKVVVTPEQVGGIWRPSMEFWWSGFSGQLREHHQALLLGVETPAEHTTPGGSLVDRRYYDTAIALGSAGGQVSSRQPAPGGAWRPAAAISAVRAPLGEPYLVIAGKRVAVSICYEDVIGWPHWRLFYERPDVIVSMANNWFSVGLDDSAVQEQSIRSIGRLVGRPVLRARNE